MRKQTIDLNDRIETLDERLAIIDEKRDSTLKEASSYRSKLESLSHINDEYADVKAAYVAVEQQWDKLEAERIEKTGELDTLKRAVEEYGGSEFVIREFTYDDWNYLQDRISEASFEFDHRTETVKGHPKEGAFKNMVVNDALESLPPDAPEEAGAMYRHVCEYIYECANALNTVGDIDMGNSSLEEALNNSQN